MRLGRLVHFIVTFALSLIVAQAYSQQTGVPEAAPIQFKNEIEKASYTVGLYFGLYVVKNREPDIDKNMMMRGVQDALAGGQVKLSPEEIQQANLALEARAAKRMEAAAANNKQESYAFFQKNKMAPDVITLPSGLQYKVLKQGTGESPKATDTVTTNYQSTLNSGKVIDSTYERGKPDTLRVNQLIPGMQEALQLMKVGDRWQLFVPSNLGFGKGSARAPLPPAIGPNAALVIDIELMGINPPAEQIR